LNFAVRAGDFEADTANKFSLLIVTGPPLLPGADRRGNLIVLFSMRETIPVLSVYFNPSGCPIT